MVRNKYESLQSTNDTSDIVLVFRFIFHLLNGTRNYHSTQCMPASIINDSFAWENIYTIACSMKVARHIYNLGIIV